MKIFKKKWFKITFITLSTPLLLLVLAVGYVYWKQDSIVQQLLQSVNEDMPGEIEIEKSHIALFHKFPYISIDLHDVKLFADKSKLEEKEVIHLEDLYVGFNLLDIIKGNYNIKAIELEKGHIDMIQYEDGSYDIMQILGLDTESSDEESEMIHLALKKIDLDHVNVSVIHPHKNEKITLEFEHIHSKFKSAKDLMNISLDTKFFGTIEKNGKPTAMNHRLFELNTKLKYLTDIQKIVLDPTSFQLEHIELNLAGRVELSGEQNIDLTLDGKQDNFNLLIAFAPAELIPTLKSYENSGKIYLKGTVKGPMSNGRMPAINAEFGCNKGIFKNQSNKMTLDEIEFHGTFTNGAKRDLSTMKFTMNKMKAQPAAGKFDAKLVVENFNAPDIDLNLKSNFNLDFLVKFLNLENEIQNPSGFVGIEMNFHDIIDLAHPEKSLEKLNESYYTEFIVKDLSFNSKSYPLPIRNFNIHADVNGNKLTLAQFNGTIGKSDINMNGSVSDLPAILHASNKQILAKLNISAKHIDVAELTYDSKQKKSVVNEVIENFNIDLSFKAIGKDLFETEKLPIGEFIINGFNAKLLNYPHHFHDFSAGLFIEKNDIKIKRFKGFIDESDFLFYGKLESYEHLFKPTSKAKSEFKVFFKSDLIKLNNLLNYNGENLLPVAIQQETFSDVKLKATIGARFEGDEMKGARIELSEFSVTTSMHNKRFSNLNGKIFASKNSIALKNLKGNIGVSDFDISLNYFIGEDLKKKRKDNEIKFYSKYFDLNEIMSFNYAMFNDQASANPSATPVEETPFTVKDIPFMDMKLETDIGHFEYLDYKLDRVKGNINMTKNGVLDFYRFGFNVAGGKVRLTGKLDASNLENVVFTPSFWIKDLILDQTLVRFKNFGQENILSENLSGKLNARIKGTIPMNSDLTPKMESTNLTLDVTILDGELRNYKQLQEFASFFGDKNLNKIRFDTLHNVFTLNNNLFTIPWMTINSSIGFIEVAGTQMLDEKMDMEYYLKIPLKLVTGVAYQKLFKRKEEEIDPEQEDEIQFQGEKRVAFINLKMIGDANDFSISLGKDKRKKNK